MMHGSAGKSTSNKRIKNGKWKINEIMGEPWGGNSEVWRDNKRGSEETNWECTIIRRLRSEIIDGERSMQLIRIKRVRRSGGGEPGQRWSIKARLYFLCDKKYTYMGYALFTWRFYIYFFIVFYVAPLRPLSTAFFYILFCWFYKALWFSQYFIIRYDISTYCTFLSPLDKVRH